MKTFLSFVLFGSICLFLSSCQREPGLDLPDPNSNPGNDSTHLWKYIELDPTLASGSDTLYKIVFFYDNQRRVSKYYDYDFLTPISVDTGIVEYFYYGNDTLPYKTTSSYHENFISLDTTYYFYKNGIVSLDSSTHYTKQFFNGSVYETRSLIVRSFMNAGNTTVVSETLTHIEPPSTGPCISTITMSKTYSNGDIIKEQAASTGCVIGTWSSQLSYDDKINPFYQKDIHYPVYTKFSDDVFGAQKNNVIEKIESLNNNNPVEFVYTYRPDNYPTAVQINDPANSLTVKALFLYTR